MIHADLRAAGRAAFAAGEPCRQHWPQAKWDGWQEAYAEWSEQFSAAVEDDVAHDEIIDPFIFRR